MRLGSTSYVYPADILPNVERLAGIVDDIELVLFEVDDYGSNLPNATTVDRLRKLAATHDLTYTVHLPLDLRLADDGPTNEEHPSLVKARRVIECTRALEPWGYVFHLNGEALLDHPTTAQVARWQMQAQRSLEIVCSWVDDPYRLCLENVKHWDPSFFAPLVERLPISRCIDVGHLWAQGVDPLGHLNTWLDRTRVVHLHGLAERDHRSLAHMSPQQLDPVVALLVARYRGVVTLEVFGVDDFFSSRAAWEEATARVEGSKRGLSSFM